MVTCPQCGAQNLPGMAYCENCGTPLPQQTAPSQPAPAPQNIAPTIDTTAAPTPTDPAAAAMPQPVMPVDQPPAGPDAGVAAPAEGANVIAAGAPAEGANVVAADPSEAPTIEAPPPQQATPAVPAAAGATTLTIIFPSGQLYTMQGDSADVGRADVAQNWHPDLDVIPFGGGAPDLGVSRHQGRLVRQDSGFVVIDVGSTNGTYVNGQAVPYNQPVELHDGDTLSFGALNTKLSIK